MLGADDSHETLEDRHRRLGALMLWLLVEKTWVHRRVEKVTHSDPVTVRRTKSIDFTFPASLRSPLEPVDGRRVDYVPLAVFGKWRVANVDVRSATGAAMPLVERREHTPIAAAMLVALAHLTRGLPVPMSISASQMPRPLERVCWEIAAYREERSLGLCEHLPSAAADDDPISAEWRRELAGSYLFMGLAWMMARGFLFLVPIYDAAGVRQIVKFSYDAYRYRPKHKSWSFNQAWWGLRNHIDPARASEREPVPVKKKKQLAIYENPQAEQFGRLLIQIRWHAGRSSTLTEPASTPKVLFSLVPPGGGLLQVEVVGTEGLVENLPVGEWVVHQPGIDGYEKTEPLEKRVEVRADATASVSFSYDEQPKRVVSLKPPVDVPEDSWLSWMVEELGLGSRKLMFSLWMDRYGSGHFEYEAPDGFVVTRTKLSKADSNGRVLDMTARSSQRASLYAFGTERPTLGLLLANVRPRSETIVDFSWVMACVTAITLTAYATWHCITGHAPSNIATVFLASPGALAAFAAQAPREVIVNRMTAGLRYFSLLPGLVAFSMAVTTVAMPKALGGKVLDGVLAVAAIMIAWIWTLIHRYSLSPPERSLQGPALWGDQRLEAGKTASTNDEQSAEEWHDRPAFDVNDTEISVYLERVTDEIEKKCKDDHLWTAYEIRSRLRKESQPIPDDLRKEYLGHVVECPPSMFIDMAEVAPTFVGLDELHSKTLSADVSATLASPGSVETVPGQVAAAGEESQGARPDS